MIQGIKFASVPVRDQDRALEFYTQKLGFTVLSDLPFNEKQRWIELEIPGADTRLVLFTPDGHEGRIGGFTNVVFYSDDVPQTYLELIARGVEFIMPPTTAEWGTSSIFKDLDGNQFALSSR